MPSHSVHINESPNRNRSFITFQGSTIASKQPCKLIIPKWQRLVGNSQIFKNGVEKVLLPIEQSPNFLQK